MKLTLFFSIIIISLSINAQTQTTLEKSIQKNLINYNKNTQDYATNVRLGWLYYSYGKYTNALHHYKNATAKNNSSIEAKLGLVLVYLATKNYLKAEKQCLSIIKIDSLNFNARLYLNDAQVALKKFTNAETHLNLLLKYYPANSTVLYRQAYLYQLWGKTVKAAAINKKIAALFQ